MNIEKLKSKTLTELLELRTATETICEDYAKRLTDYATMYADPQFQRMPARTQELYKRREKFVEFLEKIKSIIEEKIMVIYNE